MARTTILPWRLATGIVGGCAFLVLAGLVRPDWTRAADLPPAVELGPAAATTPSSGRAVATPDAAAPPALGTLENERFVVEIHAGSPEPWYVVRDRATNDPLGPPMTGAEVAARFPGIDLPALRAGDDAPEQLMRHDDPDADLR